MREMFVDQDVEGGPVRITLPAVFGELLSSAEEQFGPRDLTYTPIGFAFSVTGPENRFPSPKRALILLHLSALRHWPLAIYQLAHETFHLLAPTGGENAPVLEEGLAVWFAEQRVHAYCPNNPVRTLSKKYIAARALVVKTIPNFEVIKLIRESQPSFRSVTTQLLTSSVPKMSADLATLLLTRFANVDTEALEAGITDAG
jgi:hypothetical protein